MHQLTGRIRYDNGFIVVLVRELKRAAGDAIGNTSHADDAAIGQGALGYRVKRAVAFTVSVLGVTFIATFSTVPQTLTTVGG